MPCLFCQSSSHLSQFCDIHATDESRSKSAQSNDHCPVCFCSIDKYHNEFLCGFNLKCIICFSNKHHTFYCSNKSTHPYVFVPNINEILVSRFAQMFDINEKISLGLSSQKALKLIKLNPIAIKNNMIVKNDLYNPYLNSVCFAVENFKLESMSTPYSNHIKNFLFDLNAKNLLITAKEIAINDVQISAQELFLLLSPFTISFYCNKLKPTSKIAFADICKKIPNIESIEFHNSEIEIKNTWPKDLMKYKNGNNFKKLIMKIEDYKFDVQSLGLFMKEKCRPDIHVHLNVKIEDERELQILKNNLNVNFVSATPSFNEQLKLHIFFNTNVEEVLYNMKL